MSRTNKGFLNGDIVYLRSPNITNDILNGNWHNWFNDCANTSYLQHGVIPVTRESQSSIVQSKINDPSTLIFSIVEIESDEQLGVISLDRINHLNRTAEIAIVMGFKKVPLAALEAMALVTKHGFDRLNLNRIEAGQHIGLWKWINTLELIGYRLEGYREHAGVRNGRSYDIVLTGITAENFYELEKKRGGRILTESIHDLSKLRRNSNRLGQIKQFLASLYAQPD